MKQLWKLLNTVNIGCTQLQHRAISLPLCQVHVINVSYLLGHPSQRMGPATVQGRRHHRMKAVSGVHPVLHASNITILSMFAAAKEQPQQHSY